MKVYAVPDAIKVPEFQDCMVNGSFDPAKYDTSNDRFFDDLEAELRRMGYTGKRTGKLWRSPMADGYAIYMVAEKGSTMVLIHCPIGDAWCLPEWQTRGLTRAEVIKRVDAPKLFGEKR